MNKAKRSLAWWVVSGWWLLSGQLDARPSILRTRLVPSKSIRRYKLTETAEENKVEQATVRFKEIESWDSLRTWLCNAWQSSRKSPLIPLCDSLTSCRSLAYRHPWRLYERGSFRKRDERSLHICHKKYSVLALALKAIRLWQWVGYKQINTDFSSNYEFSHSFPQ